MGSGTDAECAEAVQLTPAQLNDVILDKCDLLLPRMEELLGAVAHLKDDLENGIIHWDAIITRARRGY